MKAAAEWAEDMEQHMQEKNLEKFLTVLSLSWSWGLGVFVMRTRMFDGYNQDWPQKKDVDVFSIKQWWCFSQKFCNNGIMSPFVFMLWQSCAKEMFIVWAEV